jgi:hypothetical protein
VGEHTKFFISLNNPRNDWERKISVNILGIIDDELEINTSEEGREWEFNEQ